VPRTQRILAHREPRGEIADTLLLRFADRRRQQGFAFGSKGICVEFDFPVPPRLRTDDLLVLDDGQLIEVVADAEPVLELRAKDFPAVARLLLALGNRHEPVQILANRVRVLHTAATAELIAAHGLAFTPMMAPFAPDGETDHDHDHTHGHHDHGHAHGDHGHAHGDHGHAHEHVHAPEHTHEHGDGRPHGHAADQGHGRASAPGHRHDREGHHE
jgi:urease accessory protein